MRLIQNGRPVPKLLVLCRKYGIDAPGDVLPQQLSQSMQEFWIQKGKPRYEITGEPPRGEDLELLGALGCIDDVCPPVQEDSPTPTMGFYQGVLLLGALRARVVSRLHYLLLWRHYLKFDAIYLLGGARPLDPIKEDRKVLCTPADLRFNDDWIPPKQMPTTEAGMMELVWQQSQLEPHWKRELVNTPLQPKCDGGTRPPNTGDTVREWLTRHNPTPGRYLVLSNQPFVQFQELVVQRVLRECGAKDFTVCACGPASSLVLPLSTYLDNIAKQVYEEHQAGA